MIKIYDRQNKKYIEEEQYGGNILNFLYNTTLGRILLKIVLNPITSKIIGTYKKSRFSKKEINKIIKRYKIDMNIFENKEYKSITNGKRYRHKTNHFHKLEKRSTTSGRQINENNGILRNHTK